MFSVSRLFASPSVAGQMVASLFMRFHPRPRRVMTRVVGGLSQMGTEGHSPIVPVLDFQLGQEMRGFGLPEKAAEWWLGCWEGAAHMHRRCGGSSYC